MPQPARGSSGAKLAAGLLVVGVFVGGLLLARGNPPALPSSLRSSASAAGTSLPAVAASVEPHEEEQKLLQAAQAALAAGDTDTAFSLLYEQATKFPKGALAPAREVTHAMALCRAGKQADARAEAAAFVVAHPDSPLSQDARRICAP
ncbi:MAG TPA: hypothetical protein VHP33_01830 [Polyangiaceae bacterium]|nr:hypothetical protein [Polyangiaceae bacterium]